MLYRIACGWKKYATCIYLQVFKSLWADLKCWWHLCVFLPTYLFIPPWVCVSCCTAQCLWGVESYSPSHIHRCALHRLKMKSNDSGVLTVVFLDLRRVTVHTTRERERNGLFSLKNSWALIIVGEVEMDRLGMRDDLTFREKVMEDQ